MFDIAPSEFLLVAIVALVVIGPKDLPKAMRLAGYWVGKARGVARQFRSGFDNMVREAELAEMEKRWAEENARIMKEHAADTPAEPQAFTAESASAPGSPPADQPDPFPEAITVEKPVVTPSAAAPADADSKAAS